MSQFIRALYGLYCAEDGEHAKQGLVEYALIIAFIAVVVIVAMVFLQGHISALFSKVGNSLTGDGVAAVVPPQGNCLPGDHENAGPVFGGFYARISADGSGRLVECVPNGFTGR